MKNSLIFICSIILLTVSCSKSDNSTGSSTFGLGAAAVESLPQIRQDSKAGNRATTGENIEDFNTLATFFKLQCIMPGMDNFCPAGVDATTGGDSNPYKLTSYTLIGSIYHADMYSGGFKTACEGTEATISSDSFTAAEPPGEPDKFILDYYELLSCVKQVTGDYVGDGTSYQAYSVDGTGAYQATLTTRYRNPYNGDDDPGQNDVFQVYVGLSGGTPVFLAYNYAGADTMYQRTVLLVNLVNHRFAVKHYESATDYLVAIGVGGVDRATGELNPGYYFTKFTDDMGTPDSGCVDNATGDFEADTTPCTTAGVHTTWTNSDTVADYLEITAGDRTRLEAFLERFKNDDPLEAADSPSDSDDPEYYFPYSITP